MSRLFKKKIIPKESLPTEAVLKRLTEGFHKMYSSAMNSYEGYDGSFFHEYGPLLYGLIIGEISPENDDQRDFISYASSLRRLQGRNDLVHHWIKLTNEAYKNVTKICGSEEDFRNAVLLDQAKEISPFRWSATQNFKSAFFRQFPDKSLKKENHRNDFFNRLAQYHNDISQALILCSRLKLICGEEVDFSDIKKLLLRSTSSVKFDSSDIVSGIFFKLRTSLNFVNTLKYSLRNEDRPQYLIRNIFTATNEKNINELEVYCDQIDFDNSLLVEAIFAIKGFAYRSVPVLDGENVGSVGIRSDNTNNGVMHIDWSKSFDDMNSSNWESHYNPYSPQ